MSAGESKPIDEAILVDIREYFKGYGTQAAFMRATGWTRYNKLMDILNRGRGFEENVEVITKYYDEHIKPQLIKQTA